MSPELITTIKERLAMGYELEAIKAELRTTGYDEQTIEAAMATAQSEEPVPTTAIPSVVGNTSDDAILPKVKELLVTGLTFVRQRPDVLVLVVTPFLLLSSMDFVMAYFEIINVTALLAVTIINIAVFVFYLVTLTAAFYLTFQNKNRDVSLKEGLCWGKRNIFGFLWVWILGALVIWGGFFLLIIPGIIVMVYTAFSQYVYVAEGSRGMNAVLRSRSLVLGNWWALATRLFLVSAVFLIIFFFVALLVGLLLAAFSIPVEGSIAGDFIFGLVAQVLGGVAMLVGLKIGFILYESLAACRPFDRNTPIVGKKRYLSLVFFGLLFLVIMIMGIVSLVGLSDVRDTGPQAQFDDNQIDFKQRAEELRQKNE